MTAPAPSVSPASAGFVEWVRDAASALGSLPADPALLAALVDDELVAAVSSLAELRQLADLDAVQEREHTRRDERSLTLHRRVDGMARLSWLLDPESAPHVTVLYDRATSPRLGGPRTGAQFLGSGDGGRKR